MRHLMRHFDTININNLKNDKITVIFVLLES